MWTEQQNNFWEQMWPLAQQAGASTGISPELIFAQSALETGWGVHAPNNNYFGIKGPGSSQSTREFVNGQWVTTNAGFRGYSSMADSVKGWVDFITGNPRYAGVAGAGDATAQAHALQRAGYATDPNYAQKIGGILNNLPQLSGLPALPTFDSINKWFMDHTGMPLDDPNGTLNPDWATKNSPVQQAISDKVSSIVDGVMTNLAGPLKRTGFVVLAIVLIAVAFFLMAGNRSAATAS